MSAPHVHLRPTREGVVVQAEGLSGVISPEHARSYASEMRPETGIPRVLLAAAEDVERLRAEPLQTSAKEAS